MQAMAKQVRLGIVGLGAQGSMYAQLITDGIVPNMEIGAVCEPNPAMAETIRSRYPGVELYVDFSAMLDSGDVDAVVICVPPFLHPEMAIAALERGIHALVEKPAGVYTKQVRELNDYAATVPELSFAMMFNQRNNPLYGRIKRSSTAARSAGSVTLTGSSRPGGDRRPTTNRVPGGQPGAVREAAFWSTRPRTSSTCGSGSAAYRGRFTPRSGTASGVTSRSKTR